jgi:hypothetical protein
MARCDANINFNWTGTSPAPGTINQYNFSARWSRVFYQNAGTYRVTATTDDGVRIWIDGVLIIDAWGIQSVRTFQSDVMIFSGNHTWTVEYFQAEGQSVIQVTSQQIR